MSDIATPPKPSYYKLKDKISLEFPTEGDKPSEVRSVSPKHGYLESNGSTVTFVEWDGTREDSASPVTIIGDLLGNKIEASEDAPIEDKDKKKK